MMIKENIAFFYSNSNGETIISESDIDNAFESIYCTIISNIEKSPQSGSAQQTFVLMKTS